jgi:hypothetical protein
VPGARRRPRRGEPCFGLYEHKASFGARWVESAPAHEIVLRPWTYRAAAIARGLIRLARLRRMPTGASGGPDAGGGPRGGGAPGPGAAGGSGRAGGEEGT